MKAYIFISIVVLLTGCKNSSEKLAGDLCNCMKDAGLKSGLDMDSFEKTFNKDLPCFKEFLEKLYAELKPLKNKERAAFMKDFSKALLNTDCGHVAFDLLPYDIMMKQFESSLDAFDNNGFSDFGNEVSVCDCINLKSEADAELNKKCKILENEWKEKYQNGSESDKEQLMNEIRKCETVEGDL